LLLKQLPQCKAIVTTGQKATDIIRSQIDVEEPKVGKSRPFEFEDRTLRLYRMPSSSRAYPLAIEKKASVYRFMLNELDFLR
jgi:G:T/U-mismatch repair DNA glycosylase